MSEKVVNVVNVVNVFHKDIGETNRGFVSARQDITPGIYLDDEYGHYAVAEVSALPGQSVTRSLEDNHVFSGQDLID